MRSKEEKEMKKLFVSAITFALFALIAQESSAREVRKVKSINSFMPIESDMSYKAKKVFSKKNKALTNAISELKNKIKS